jgi:hypothetical protein
MSKDNETAKKRSTYHVPLICIEFNVLQLWKTIE